MMPKAKICKDTSECDVKYISREWLWKGVAILIAGCIGVIFAAGSFVTKTNLDIELIKSDVAKLQQINSDIDTIKTLLKQSNNESR